MYQFVYLHYVRKYNYLFYKIVFFFDFWKNVAVSLFGCNNMPMTAGAVLALLLCVSVFYFQQIRSALMFVVSVGGHIGPPLHVAVC